MTVACLAKTQRAASLGALCYMLAVALVLLLCQQNNISACRGSPSSTMPRTCCTRR